VVGGSKGNAHAVEPPRLSCLVVRVHPPPKPGMGGRWGWLAPLAQCPLRVPVGLLLDALPCRAAMTRGALLLEGALVACLAASAVAFIPGAPAVGRVRVVQPHMQVPRCRGFRGVYVCRHRLVAQACVRQTRGAVYATPQPVSRPGALRTAGPCVTRAQRPRSFWLTECCLNLRPTGGEGGCARG
jgi:hypothetical protein